MISIDEAISEALKEDAVIQYLLSDFDYETICIIGQLLPLEFMIKISYLADTEYRGPSLQIGSKKNFIQSKIIVSKLEKGLIGRSGNA